MSRRMNLRLVLLVVLVSFLAFYVSAENKKTEEQKKKAHDELMELLNRNKKKDFGRESEDKRMRNLEENRRRMKRMLEDRAAKEAEMKAIMDESRRTRYKIPIGSSCPKDGRTTRTTKTTTTSATTTTTTTPLPTFNVFVNSSFVYHLMVENEFTYMAADDMTLMLGLRLYGSEF